MFHRLIFALVVMLLSVRAAEVAGAPDDTGVRESLKQRYTISRIEVQNKATQSAVVREGTVFIVQADALPARSARYVQTNTKSPTFHVHDYAKVEIIDGQLVPRSTSELTLAKGTRLVLLDMRVARDTVRLFTHTAEPVATIKGKPAYGCTELVFRFAPGVLEGSDAAPVYRAIEHWLVRA